MKSYIKRALLSAFYPAWRSTKRNFDGYSIVVPAPMDMPFLTYWSLRGLNQMDLSNCHEILVVPDGCGKDEGRSLMEAIKLSGVDRVRLLPVTNRNRAVISLFGDSGIAHWMTIVEAINHSETEWLFLHDADAFFTEKSLLEDNYAVCKASSMKCLGVTARWDPLFTSADMYLPGTWELFFSRDWARTWSPISHKAGNRYIDGASAFFDTMLYPMYRDYGCNGIGIRRNESFMHLSGTVVTYRRWLDYINQSVGDELYRLLFLCLLRELSPDIESECRLPKIVDLYNGLNDSNCRVHYRFPDAAINYQEFNKFIRAVLNLDLFSPYSARAAMLLKPFDDALLTDDSDKKKMFHGVRAHCLYLG